MGTTLQHGIFLPAEGERNCYTGLASNWTILDGVIGGYSAHAANLTIHVTAADKEAWNGKADASALTAHTGDTTIHVTAADKQAWNGKADASALAAHTGDTTIHVTAEDKAKWDAVTGKADASALTAHTGDTTIHVTAEDKQAWNGKADASALTAHTGDTTIHVTAEDKAAWNGKANDADVVHKSGNETINGNKTFSSINGVEPSSLSLPSGNNFIDISSYFSNTGNGDTNSYTASANGWIYLRLSAIGSCQAMVYDANNNRRWGQSSQGGIEQITIPILKGQTLTTQWSTTSSVNVANARFIPCLGNI